MPDELVVVDASVIAAFLMNESSAAAIEQALGGRVAIAPSLLTYEVANVALRKSQLYPEQADGIRRAVTLVGEIILDLVQISPDRLLETGRTSGLTSYDAAYLCLSLETGAPLFTLDRAMATAAERMGIQTLRIE